MRSQIRFIFFFFVAFILLVDGISFAGLAGDFPAILHPLSLAVFWVITLLFIVRLAVYGRTFLSNSKPGFFAGFYLFTGFFLAFYVPKLFYIAFFSMMVVFWGMLFGRFNFKVRRSEITYTDIPPAFDGYRIIQISDLHLGSLYGYQEKLRRAINLINNESPDLILFTGDLVNNLAEETEGWEDLLAGLHAPDGNYAILGNHDYGEYYDWPDEKAHQENMQKLIRAHKDSGFTLLLNRSVKVSRNDEDIFLAGVENWGLPPFKQYGDLAKALQDVPDAGFTILLSHDPSHWDEEVTDRTGVHLTLSGHTHGMQFGIRIGKFRWSPIQIKYPRWVGFYQQGYQYLHVNPGLGYIGYAGRIGIPPEISVITLKRSTS
jgi:predicted MPP superfamily phosphohydrolase